MPRSAADPTCRAISLRTRPATLLLALTPLLTCGFPTDESRDLSVTIETLSAVLVRGDSILVVARAWRGDPGNPTPVHGVSYGWDSDSSVAVVSDREDGSAWIRGIDTGTTGVVATVKDYEDAQPGRLTLRVTNTVTVDRVQPDTVQYGQQITVHGTGLGRITRATLGEVNLIPVPSSFVGDSTGLGEQRFWVPYPATSNRLLAVVEEGFSAPARDSTIVLGTDIYSAGNDEPALITLEDGGGVLFSNPALALTAAGASERDFHFVRADTTRPLTFIVTTYAFTAEPYVPTLSSSPLSRMPPSSSTWATGIGRQFCLAGIGTLGFRTTSPPFTVVQALTSLPSRDVYLHIAGKTAGRFGIQVIDGYRTADPRIEADGLEENDYCLAADSDVVTLPFADGLTIDNGFESDWLRFTLPPVGTDSSPQLVTVRTESRPFGASDSSDVNISVGAIPFAEFDEPPGWLGTADTRGSSERLTLELAPGDYYLLVEDGVGVPTRYSLCIGLGVDCSFPPAR